MICFHRRFRLDSKMTGMEQNFLDDVRHALGYTAVCDVQLSFRILIGIQADF